ncbi:MAG: DNA polymerase III subunit chi [Proteobacteria bacterium]|nr:DNA polymerase III subunit chi [Pseudomonadota bacterium]MDE3207412.1 DNA polymerase III subunit chi [Pseudomonadota bacterium]
MTRIDFYTHVKDSLHLACILCSKAQVQGNRVFVLCQDTDLCTTLDQMLWSFRPASFVPHCKTGDSMAPVAPILIGTSLNGEQQDDIMLNLSGKMPHQFSRFQRLIEIVTLDKDDAALARERVMSYRSRGYAVTFHNLKNLSRPTQHDERRR